MYSYLKSSFRRMDFSIEGSMAWESPALMPGSSVMRMGFCLESALGVGYAIWICFPLVSIYIHRVHTSHIYSHFTLPIHRPLSNTTIAAIALAFMITPTRSVIKSSQASIGSWSISSGVYRTSEVAATSGRLVPNADKM